MGKPSKQTIEDLRGLTKLVSSATKGTSNLVETMHNTIERIHPPLGESKGGATEGVTGLIYKGIRGGTKLVTASLDLAMQSIAPFLDEAEQSSPSRDVFLSVINGVYGDKLAEQKNSLALEMRFMYENKALKVDQISADIKQASSKLMLFIHGLQMSHHCWDEKETNLSRQMAEELGFTPIYLHYNTGQSIASNGKKLARQLETLMDNWPISVSNLTIIGHSMGGLLARSAYYHGEQENYRWLTKNKTIVSIGTPHNGALLEKGGVVLESLMQRSPYAVPFTRITKIRSRGIENLRYGSITNTDEKFTPLPTSVEFYAIATVLNKKPNAIAEQTIGDGLVTLDSAFGQRKEQSCCLSIPEKNKWLGYNIGHIDMVRNTDVFKKIQQWLTGSINIPQS